MAADVELTQIVDAKPQTSMHEVFTEKFGGEKLIRLHFSSDAPKDLARFGEVTLSGPEAEIKVDRARVSEVLSTILDQYTLIDLSVEDPPLEQVIARVFEEGRERQEAAGVAS